MNGVPPLLADGWEEVIGTVVFLVVAFVVWLFQNVGKMIQRRPQRPAGPGQQVPAQGGLNDEIGEFLQKVAQRRQQPPPPQPRQRPVEQPVRAEVVRGRQPSRAEVALQQARRAAEAARQRAGTRQVVATAEQYTAPHPQPHRRVEQPQRQPGALGGVVIAKPEHSSGGKDRIGSRAGLEGAFAAARSGTGASAGGAMAAGLYAMLTDPGSVRQAILLSEILNRPVDRW